ncbi:DUF2141 domain-containing protein [Tsuneonella mangrovi]|uniref:DUF2141 domain-containing protein n=1 Tax=Tsuneonella mangrovi TaxID=1982042 RepID=UPI001F0A5C98|nr:DUF2141 domain-containing protein [Tsuneonella mangrovi]
MAVAATTSVLPGPSVNIDITGLRNAKGLVRVCMTRDAKAFPDCRKDPDSRRMSLPAAEPLRFTFTDVTRGEWAISVLHDENSNGKADRTLMIPREGFGFSRDAPVKFGPPKFSAAEFPVGDKDVTQAIRIRYML